MSTAVLEPTVDDLAALVDGAVADDRLATGSTWTLAIRDQWVGVQPTDAQLPGQGWKLHVSATAANADQMVSRCLPVLLTTRCAFKVARSSEVVAELTGPQADRVQAGKVITIYPVDEDTLRTVAAALVTATADLGGPRILTDRPVSPGSVVHYRYGAFAGVPTFGTDGRLTAALRAPDGSTVTDQREAGFTPPPWAVDPFAPAAAPASRRTGSELLAQRYQVRGAIRHAARGGVFRAVDTWTGDPVVIKQARHHIAEYVAGEDTRARLCREAEILTQLGDVDKLPRMVELFELEGDRFLVESDLGGTSLRNWVGRLGPVNSDNAVAGTVLALLIGLAETVVALHDRGIALRDLSPNNVMVDADGRYLGLVDLETVLRPGEDPVTGRGATPGYAAPEWIHNATVASDIYSLAAIIAFAFTREHPGRERWLPSLDAWLRVGGRLLRLPADLTGIVARMGSVDPTERPAAAEVLAALVDTPLVLPSSDRAVAAALLPCEPPLVDAELDLAIDELTDLVLAGVDVGSPTFAVAASSVGRSMSPCNVHHGSGGVLLALARSLRSSRRPDSVRAVLDELLTWTMNRARDLPEGSPVGLSFGTGGTAMAVAEAADVLGRGDALGWAVDYALSAEPTVATAQSASDLTHGAAGLGLCLLQLWDRTHDPRIATKVHQLTDQFADEATRDHRGLGWPIGKNGARPLGFAHGLAGITQFLLGAAGRFDLPRCRAVADEAVATLVDSTVLVDGCARWQIDLSDHPATPTWWCHGTAGVIATLVAAPPGAVPAAVFRAAARALTVDRWQYGISYCHGLSGAADALLDLNQALPGEGWRSRAAELLGMVWARREPRPEGLWLGDRGVGSVIDLGVGHAGVLATMLRWRDGGPRVVGSVEEAR